MTTHPVIGLPELRVRDIMQTDVITIPARATTAEAARLLWTRGISGAPVLDDHHKVVGVISTSDLLMPEDRRPLPPPQAPRDERRMEGAGYFLEPDAQLLVAEPLVEPAEAAPRPRLVGDVMTRATFSVRPEATIPELAYFLLHAGIHRALVLEGDVLKGIVTTFDVLRVVAGELRGARR